MMLRGFAALVGATAMLSLAVAPGWAASAQNTATHHPHRIATAAHTPQPVKMQEKSSRPATSTTNRITIVSVGPQAMATQRVRDLAMEETG